MHGSVENLAILMSEDYSSWQCLHKCRTDTTFSYIHSGFINTRFIYKRFTVRRGLLLLLVSDYRYHIYSHLFFLFQYFSYGYSFSLLCCNCIIVYFHIFVCLNQMNQNPAPSCIYGKLAIQLHYYLLIYLQHRMYIHYVATMKCKLCKIPQ